MIGDCFGSRVEGIGLTPRARHTVHTRVWHMPTQKYAHGNVICPPHLIYFVISCACHNSDESFCTETCDFDHTSERVKQSLRLNHHKTPTSSSLSIFFHHDASSGHYFWRIRALASSYRLISNLNTTSKVLERMYLVWLVPHVAPSFYPMANMCQIESTFSKMFSGVTPRTPCDANHY